MTETKITEMMKRTHRTKMDCNTCHTAFPDLLLDPALADSQAAAHLAACSSCRVELDETRATMALMDAWTAPEPSPYFDARVRAHLREAQTAAPEGLWERLAATLRFSKGRGMRPVLAGAFALVLALGGGTAATLLLHHEASPAVTSPTVNDLRIYDKNAQALEQMELLDEGGADSEAVQPQS